MTGPVLTRADDERALAAVQLRHEGRSTAQGARQLGMTRSAVVGVTLRVREADLAHPDPSATPDAIAGAYR